jgi:tRNA A-37 threonylcarbamoyl transferase component Bud32
VRETVDPLVEYGWILAAYTHGALHGMGAEALMTVVGTEIAQKHIADVVHGDLTTLNMML